jgi:hypothetical protein
MKGLEAIPSHTHLLAAYNQLLQQKRIDEESLALWSQWSRIDPRLAEILVHHLSQNWKNISPVSLQIHIHKQPWPSALAALLEQCSELLQRDQRKHFETWKNCATFGTQKAPFELFFFGTRGFAGSQAFSDANYSLKTFLKWGYFCRDRLSNKAQARPKTCLTPRARRELLTELLRRKGRITVNDYIEALGGSVSRRQAELDLKNYPRIRADGKTRNRTYRLPGSFKDTAS